MKKIFLVSLLTLLWNNLIHAQGIPQAVNYQAIARDAKGKEIINQKVSVRLSIFAQSPSGTMEWQELHEATTSPFGYILYKLVKEKVPQREIKKVFQK